MRESVAVRVAEPGRPAKWDLGLTVRVVAVVSYPPGARVIAVRRSGALLLAGERSIVALKHALRREPLELDPDETLTIECHAEDGEVQIALFYEEADEQGRYMC